MSTLLNYVNCLFLCRKSKCCEEGEEKEKEALEKLCLSDIDNNTPTYKNCL